MKNFLFIVLLVLALVGWGFYLTKVFSCKAKIKAVERKTEIRVTDSIQNRLSFKFDSLKQATDLKIDSIDSVYRSKKTKTITKYEKIFVGIDTLSIDDNIRLFTNYISEKDSIRE